jgi:hypothetical protein
VPDELLGKSPGRRKRVITQEGDDRGEVADSWLGSGFLPVGDGVFVHAELLSDLELEEAEVEPALAEVVAYRNYLSWIWLW